MRPLLLLLLLASGLSAQVIRVNAGGDVYNDPLGQTWAADNGASAGVTFSVSTPIAGTNTPKLYQSERWNSSNFQYQFSIPNGTYNVKLKFAEIYFTSAGQRIFNVAINGAAVLNNFDIVAQAGASDTAIDKTFSVNVTTGQIIIQFLQVLSNPKISAIEIVPQAVDVGLTPTVTTLAPSQTQQFTASVVGTATTGVTWSITPAGVGSISNTGLYTAPATLTRQTVTVTATSSADNTKTASASIVLSGAWSASDIGGVYVPGSSNYANGAYSVTGSGDINGAADGFRFVSQSLSGDGSITARFNSSEPCCTNATKAGVMFRASSAPNSPHVFLSIYSGIVGLLESRATAGGNTTVTFGGAGVFWVKLVRQGNTFSGFISAEGVSWIPVGSPVTVTMPSAALVGLAVSSGNVATHAVTFDNISVGTPPTVSVDQTLVSLGPSQTAQFTATVWNGATGNVTWSVSPSGAGNIGSGGLYTAPSSLPTPTTATITATSVDDPAKSSSVVVSLGAFKTIRVNAGGPSHYDPTGTFWTADTGASAGIPFSNGTPIPNTLTPYLYQSEHFNFGAFAYSFYVPNGSYQVKLKFAEIFFTSAGQRVFNVLLNGNPVLSNFDVFVQAGGAFKAFDQTFPLTVSNGQILLQFQPVTSTPKVNAIEITAATGASLQITDFNPKSAAPGALVAVTGSGFGASPQVTLNKQGGGTLPAPVTVAADTSLSFIVPTGTATGPVMVTAGNSNASSSSNLTILPSSSFTISATPSAVTLIQGQSASYTISLASGNGFGTLAALNVSGLPAGVTASFKPAAISASQSSVLTLTAPSGQAAGSFPINVSASATVDGQLLFPSAPATLTIAAPTTSFLARTVVANANETPLAGVTGKMLGTDGAGHSTGCTGTAISDAAGNLLIANLGPSCTGPQMIGFDGLTVTAPAGKYAGVNLTYTFVAGQVTNSPVLVHLPRIDNTETFNVQQNAPNDQTYSFSTIPGLAVTVYKNTILTMPDGSTPNPFPLTAVEVPIDRLPDYKPPVPTMLSAFIVAFQPANAFTSQPVAVTFPNSVGTAPGTNMAVMTLDPTLGKMVPYGTATVSPDGTQIVPDPDPAHPGHAYGLVHFDWHGPMPPPKNTNNPNNCKTCDPVDISTGINTLEEADIDIPGALNPIRLTRFYRTLTTNPGPFGIGTGHNFGYLLDTNNLANPPAVVNLVYPDGNQYPFSKQSNGTYLNNSFPELRGAILAFNANAATLTKTTGEQWTFQALGGFFLSLTQMADANGNSIAITHDTVANNLRVLQLADPVGRTLTFSYDNQNRITSVADQTGRTVTYTYNSQGTLATVTNPEGGVTQYAYDAQNRLTQITDPRNIVIAQNVYDSNGRVIQQTQSNGTLVTFAYTLANPLAPTSPVIQTTVTDGAGNQTVYRFNMNGFLTDVTDPSGQTLNIQRQSFTNVVTGVTGSAQCLPCRQIDRNAKSLAYDANGNLTTLTDLLGNTTTRTWDPVSNRLLSFTDASGYTTTYTYDSRGNLLTVTDPNGGVSTYTYDPRGLVTSSKDPANRVTTLAYDGAGNLISSTDPGGRVTRFRYDSLSRPVEITDPSGRKQRLQYDRLHRVVTRADALGNASRFTYDGAGNLVSFTNARGAQTTYTVNATGLVTKVTSPLGHVKSATYDALNNLASRTDARGQTTTYTRDFAGRITQITYGDGSTQTRAYDTRGQLVKIDDSTAGTTLIGYDLIGQLLSITSPQGKISFTRDPRGLTATKQVNGQPPITYTYDKLRHLAAASTAAANLTIAVNATGQPTSITRSNGVSTSYSYDATGRITSLVHSNGAGPIRSLSYSFDAGGYPIQIAGTGSALATTAANRTLDTEDQLTANGPTTISYDLAGNPISETGPSGTTSYIWDARGRLTGIQLPNSQTVSLQYGPLGNLAGRKVTGSGANINETYITDAVGNISGIASAAGPFTIVLNGNSPDQHYAAITGANTEFALTDIVNNTLATVDQTGTLKSAYSYEPFGATTVTGPGTYPFQFSGRLSASPNIYYTRARFYSASSGRFLSRDPIGLAGGDNAYRYVDNTPTLLGDPTGLATVRGRVYGIGGYEGVGGGAGIEILELPDNCHCQAYYYYEVGVGFGGFGKFGGVEKVSGIYDPSDNEGTGISYGIGYGIGIGGGLGTPCGIIDDCSPNSQGNVEPTVGIGGSLGGFSVGGSLASRRTIAIGSPYKCHAENDPTPPRPCKGHNCLDNR